MNGVVLAAILAGALGAVVRYGATRAVTARAGASKAPRAVLIVNIAGSLVAGILVGVTAASPALQLIVVSGFAGGLTTFSTWSVETIQLAVGGRAGAAIGNVAANLAGGLLAGVAGALLGGLLL